MTVDEFLAVHQRTRKQPQLTEHGIQVACVNWFKYEYAKDGYMILAIPNAARRSKHLGRMMKDEGLLPGSADIVIIIPGHVLFVEMKSLKGRQSETQKDFQRNVEKLGFTYIVCYGVDEFSSKVTAWIRSCIGV